MKQNQILSSSKDFSFIDSPKPPTYFNKIYSFYHHDKYNLIDPCFLVKLLEDASVQLFLFDCRYAYEYKGGHINKAIFCPSEIGLKELFFSEVKMEKVIIVFHCEYSSKRAPAMIDKFRNMDREKNRGNYPELWYPDVYLLNGGYKQFYDSYPEYCSGYVPMEQNKGVQMNQRNQLSRQLFQHQHSSSRSNQHNSQSYHSSDHSPLYPSAKNMKI